MLLQAREGCSTYFSGPWNVLDVLSSGLLLFASVFHLVGAVDVVRTAGALGVALKCFGMVDYLRSYPATGSLVRMISVRILFIAERELQPDSERLHRTMAGGG